MLKQRPTSNHNRSHGSSVVVVALALAIAFWSQPGKTIAQGLPGVDDSPGEDNALRDNALVVEDLIVVLIDTVNVPATKSGVIAELNVREGVTVTAGEQLAKLDDREARLKLAAAQTELSIANEKVEDSQLVALAEKKLAQQEQLARQHEFAREIAQQKAENEVRILASEKAEGVARNELDRAIRARQEFVDSVSRSEIDSLRLAYERTSLETKQAEFERRLDQLNAKAEEEAASAFRLGIERSKIEVAQAVASLREQKLEAELGRHHANLAELAVAQHSIVAPWNGMVVQRFRNQGDWVTGGDPVIRLIRLDRLRAEGFVSADLITKLRESESVQLTITTAPDTTITRQGTIVFISPEIDPVSHEVHFWVEFDNPKLDVLPGMRLHMKSKP